ncbi:MAG: peptide chain release factor N(5)-glutamine methyltransferase [Bacteriovoracaceae bacterium]|nr:peptide chain release factor N(5)-glutamine methyltransferase [Bacteriovoracaceae bacterium]
MSQLGKFFLGNSQLIKKNYPGITLRRLEEEFKDYLAQSKLTDKIKELEFFDKLCNGVPLAYITGKITFYKSEFFVDSSVLIPRMETELLVEQAIKDIKSSFKRSHDENFKILDLGVGSGAIILSILQEIDRPISAFATDISQAALEVAKRNFFFLRYTFSRKSTLEFIKMDRLCGFEQKLHMIITNPPYIKEKNDRVGVHHQVHSFEPHTALYLPDDKYNEWFEELFKQSFSQLYNGGIFLMEGHENNLSELKAIAKSVGFINTEVIFDLTRRPRFLKAQKSTT